MTSIDRRDFLALMGAGVAGAGFPGLGSHQQSPRPVPSPSQLEWQRDELAMFLHFGVNTFTDHE